MRNADWGMRNRPNADCGIFQMRNADWGMRNRPNADCGMKLIGECGMRIAECGLRNAE